MLYKVANRIICLIVICLSFFAINGKAQVEIFVANHGNDKNKGTLTSPYRTIQKAIQQSGSFSKNDVVIYLRGGAFFLDSTIKIFKANNSLLITNYQNEKVIISGGKPLKLAWKPFKNGVFVAEVPGGLAFEQLYINDEKQVLARYPNYDSNARVFNGTAVDAISKERVKKWENPIGAYVHALHAGEWGGFHYKVTNVNADGTLIMEGGWQNNRPNKMHDEYRFVENVFEELDTPGEWYFNKQQNQLYYFPHATTNLNNAQVVVSHLLNSIEVIGTTSEPVKNVEIKGLEFTHNERSFWYTKEPLLRSDWTIYRGGVIKLEGTETCKITDCHFYNVGGNAVMISGYNKSDSISGCHVERIGASAVCFVGSAKAVRSPSFRYENYVPYIQMDKTPGPLSNDFPQQCIATNNLIHNVGEIEKQATGIQIEIASQISVSHNSIYNTPRAGINIGDGCFGGHILEFNDVFNAVLETGDHGAFNSWGRDRFWAPDRGYMDSLVSVHPELILLDAQQTTTIRNNRFRCDHGWDIDLDDGSSNYSIYNNVCLNGGLKLREGFYRTVKNNIMVNNTFHPHVWFKNSGDVFEHNIVMKKYAPIGINHWGKSVDRNLFPDTGALQVAQANGTDRNSVAGNPQFMNAAAGNYTVAAGSPALAIGFVNFAMDDFGVQKPSLRKLAAKPIIPPLLTVQGGASNTKPTDFMGGVIKGVDGLGDRSAYGLPDETGVVVVKVNANTLLDKSGLKEGDVIREADGSPIRTISDLLEVCQTSGWKPTIEVSIIRNQQPQKLILHLK
jgi:hypothetical protein